MLTEIGVGVIQAFVQTVTTEFINRRRGVVTIEELQRTVLQIIVELDRTNGRVEDVSELVTRLGSYRPFAFLNGSELALRPSPTGETVDAALSRFSADLKAEMVKLKVTRAESPPSPLSPPTSEAGEVVRRAGQGFAADLRKLRRQGSAR